MELINRYLYQVGRHLPKSEKEDTLNELKSIILDQLDDKINSGIGEDEAIQTILEELGDPYTVAFSYRNVNPLLSRELNQIMWFVIKIPSIAIPIGLFVAKTVEFISNNNDFTIMDLLLNWAYAIPSILTSVIMVMGSIFFIFLMIERYGNIDFDKAEFKFNPKDLPPPPKKLYKVSVIESVIVILGSTIFLYIINFNQGLIAIHDLNGVSRGLLNDNFDRILPFINLNIMLAMGVAIYHLAKRRKNKITRTLDVIHNIFSAVVLIFLGSLQIFDTVLLEDYNLQFIQNMFKVVMYVLAVFTIIGAISEFFKTFTDRD